MPDDLIYTRDDVLGMLDRLLGRGGAWWDEFYADRSRAIPFFTGRPDESLAAWLAGGLIAPARVLELGCGNGRNSVHLASQGAAVDAIDFSAQAVGWATARAQATGHAGAVTFQCCSIFDAVFPAGSYDLVYDSGCFHHLAPHRRLDYAELVQRALKPGGSLGLTCFRPEGGSGLTDQQVYERASLGGGLGYTAGQLRSLWDRPPFTVRVLRQMDATAEQDPWFGEDVLWVLLATKTG